MQQFVHRLWYQRNHPLRWVLLPLTLLFYVISAIRRQLFRWGIKPVYHSPVPVIVVGNLTAGGSGKTPMVLYLISLCRANGYRPGVISRGYGVNITGSVLVSDSHTCADVGDEPAMIFARTHVPMVVGANRVDAVKTLLAHCDVDVIICDDGLQHYALGRDIELAIIDGERRLGNGLLLPAGPLREGAWRLDTVDFKICNGLEGAQAGEFAMQLAPAGLHGLTPHLADNIQQAPQPGDTVVAMAGIGNPGRFFTSLTALGFVLAQTREFADHQPYIPADLASLAAQYPLLMTEKDAVKCRHFATDNWWYLAVDAKLPAEFDQGLLQRLAKIQSEKSSRDSIANNMASANQKE